MSFTLTGTCINYAGKFWVLFKKEQISGRP